jgi:hypothetical protein
MNPIHTVRRLACMLTGLDDALAAAAAIAPAATAATHVHPAPVPPAELIRFGPAAHTFNGAAGGGATWQIALVAAVAALAGAVLCAGVLLDRARAARAHRAATAA